MAVWKLRPLANGDVVGDRVGTRSGDGVGTRIGVSVDCRTFTGADVGEGATVNPAGKLEFAGEVPHMGIANA